MSRANVIAKGSFLTVATGDYSDYTVWGVFRAAKDIDPDQLLAKWLSENPDQREPHHFRESGFLAWVAEQGFLEAIDSVEWHLGSYGTAEMWTSTDD